MKYQTQRIYRLIRLTTTALLLQLAVTNGFARSAETTPSDSLRQLIPQLRGAERRAAWQNLYNLTLADRNVEQQFLCLDEWIADANQQGDVEGESTARTNKLIDYFNNALYDSLYLEAPRVMEFNRSHGVTRYYFWAWHLLVSAYEINGKYNTALREVEKMHEAAVDYGDNYGQGVAYFDMGNVYNNMGHVNQAIDVYSKSLPLLRDMPEVSAILLEVYPSYCDALDAKGSYQELQEVTQDWQRDIEMLKKRKVIFDGDPTLANFYIAQAQAALGQNRLEDAQQALSEAEALVKSREAYENLYILYYKAQLRLKQGRIDEADQLSAERLALCQIIEDKPTLIPAHMLRARVLMAAGRYKEAAEMYRRTYELSDSLNTAATTTQLNELSTLFRVDELEMKNALQRSNYIIIIVALVAIALLVITILYYRWARKLRQKNDELAHSNAELKVANKRAEESSKMKTEFIHNISHEIRTPLNAISGFSQIVTDRSVPIDDDKLADIRSQITQNTDRITRLVNKMLELSDANSRTIIERCDDVLAVQIAVSATEESRISQSDKFEFILDVSEEVSEVWLHTNQEYAEQALSQLLFNAEKFTNEGSVTLRVELAGDVVRFIVEDTGIGIAEADRSRIFDEFVQINTNYEGTGIGLPVARSIAQRLGGDVVLDNNYINGSRFIMTLPT